MSVKDPAFEPDFAFPPGATLRETLAELEMSQSQLADRLNVSEKHVSQLMHGHVALTYETAVSLERVTGVPAGTWNALEARYRDHELRRRRHRLNAEEISWMRQLPLRELLDRGLLDSVSEDAHVYDQVTRFFGVADHAGWKRVWVRPVGSFKRSPAYRSDPGAVATWLRLGELDAIRIECEPFDASRFRSLLKRVRQLTRKGGFEELVGMCADVGVAVVFVREVGKCRASGAARWMTPSKAIIQLSDRYKRDDSLWFSFFHEAGHLLLHSKKEVFINDGSEDDDVEDEANRFARDVLIPPAEVSELRRLETAGDVNAFASRIGIAPSIVAGRLANDELWSWSRVAKLRKGLRIVD
jgi:HTH-type transcriptional regulator/antitoxin HigA